MSHITTVAPAAQSFCDAQSPMPDAAPVMTAVRPLNSPSFIP